MTEAAELLSEIDALAGRLARLVVNVEAHVEGNYHLSRHDGLDASFGLFAADPGRWTELGRDHLQQGLMCLRRAVQRPDNF
jgi:hypothetical protein